MSTSADTFDFAFDLKAERRRRLRRFLHVVFPIGTLVILLSVIGGIGIYLYQANRDDARVLTDDLLEELERRIASEVVAFLQPASAMVGLAEEILKDRALREQRERLAEPLTMHILANNPQLSTFSFADIEGNFMMLKKWPDGSIHTKLMDRSNGRLDTRWVRRDASGNVLRVEHDPTDTYDPRTRPWYRGAVETGELYWSDVYIFFTDQLPGITASLPVFDAGGELAAVYSVDIALEKLSTFLARLEIGRSGIAMIIDDDGNLVAFPQLKKMVKKAGGTVERVQIEELQDPVLNRVFDRFRVDGSGKRELVVDGRRYINTALSLKAALGRDWALLIVAPEEDFVGFVAENNRRGLYMSVAVLALASLLAGLLVVQGLRADRNAQLVFERQKQLEVQSRAFSGLASQAALFDSGNESAIAELTETVARTVNARRVSIWNLDATGQRLVCEDAYDKDDKGHTGGMELTEDEIPQFFQSLEQKGEVVTVDAAADPRTAELHRIYLHPLGCRALASLPIIQGERTRGAVCLEDDVENLDELKEDVAFTRAVANMLALRMQVYKSGEAVAVRNGAPRREASEPKALAEPMRRTDLAMEQRGEAFMSRISNERGHGAGNGAQIFKDVSVVVIRFADPMTLATAIDDGRDNVAVDLVQKLETSAVELGVEYLKLLGNQMVCAAGFNGDSHASADVMAEFALGALEHCTRLVTALEKPLNVQIGIDSGPAIGSAVGRDRSIFNVWGEAVLTASRMAETGVPGHIQATESTYREIREDFLFRVRGSYYLEGYGEFTTYTLTGRL